MLASLTAPDGPGGMEVVRKLMEQGNINIRSSKVPQAIRTNVIGMRRGGGGYQCEMAAQLCPIAPCAGLYCFLSSERKAIPNHIHY